MSLFPEIDEQKTKDNVKAVLSGYIRLKQIAGERVETKMTATYSFEPRSQTNATHSQVEQLVTRKVQAEKALEKIEDGINAIIDAYARQAIIERYCRLSNRTNEMLCEDLKIEPTEFYRLLNVGFFEFAHAYDYGSLLVEIP